MIFCAVMATCPMSDNAIDCATTAQKPLCTIPKLQLLEFARNEIYSELRHSLNLNQLASSCLFDLARWIAVLNKDISAFSSSDMSPQKVCCST